MIRIIRTLCCCLFIGGWAGHAMGQLAGGEQQREVIITLDTGEVLRGPLVEQTAENYTLDHDFLGEIVIPIVRVRSLEVVQPGADDKVEALPEAPGEQEPVVIPTDEGAKQEPKPEAKGEGSEAKLPPEPAWSGSLELGMNGAQGNTELQRARMSLNARRTAEHETFDLRVTYQAAQTFDKTTENRFFARAKNEWATRKKDWRVFVEGSAERDQFRDFDWRLTGNAGFAYDAFKEDATTLTLRAGVGGSTEFGAPNDGFEPEGTLAYELRHRLNKRVSLTSTGEFITDLKNTSEFRARVNAAIDTKLDDSGAWRLRIGVEDRYESMTTRAEKNDFDYFVSLVYRF